MQPLIVKCVLGVYITYLQGMTPTGKYQRPTEYGSRSAIGWMIDTVISNNGGICIRRELKHLTRKYDHESSDGFTKYPKYDIQI